jgi:hypothetical protein
MEQHVQVARLGQQHVGLILGGHIKEQGVALLGPIVLD